MTDHFNHDAGGTDALYERRDVNVRGILWTAALVTAGFVIALVLAWVVLRLATGVPERYLPLFPEAPRVPRPTLQVSPQQDLAEFRAIKLERLNSYGGMERNDGFIHIPIQEAMARVAEQGLPRWSPPEHPDAATTAHQARQRAVNRQQETP